MAQPIYFEPFFFRQELLQKQHEEKMRGLATIPLAIRDLSQTMFEYANTKRQDAKDKVDALSSVIHQWGSKAGQPAMNAYGNALDTLMGNKVVPRDEHGDVLKIPPTFAEEEQAHLNSLPPDQKAKMYEMKAGLIPDANHEATTAWNKQRFDEEMQYKWASLKVKAYQGNNSDAGAKRRMAQEPSGWIADEQSPTGFTAVGPDDPRFGSTLTNERFDKTMKQTKLSVEVLSGAKKLQDSIEYAKTFGVTKEVEKHLDTMRKQIISAEKDKLLPQEQIDALKMQYTREFTETMGRNLPVMPPKDERNFLVKGFDAIHSAFSTEVKQSIKIDPTVLADAFREKQSKGVSLSDSAQAAIMAGYDEETVKAVLQQMSKSGSTPTTTQQGAVTTTPTR